MTDVPAIVLTASASDPRWLMFCYLPVDELKLLVHHAEWNAHIGSLENCNAAAEILQLIYDNAAAVLPPDLSPATLAGLIARVYSDVLQSV